jgi:iron complex outermembrane receptor protein
MDEVQTKGIGLEFGRKVKNGINGKVSYTFQETEDQATGRILTNSPKHLAKLNMTLPLIEDKLFIGIEEQFTSKRKTLTGSHTDGFFMTNLTLFSQNLIEGMKISGSVYNLFDKKYDDPGSSEHLQDEIEQDGRLFRIKFTFSF